MSASDDPACVSDSAIVPENRPASIGRRNVSTCSEVPNCASRLALAMVSIRYPVVLMLAAENQAKPACATVTGSCAATELDVDRHADKVRLGERVQCFLDFTDDGDLLTVEPGLL